jgi:DNA polymerase-4
MRRKLKSMPTARVAEPILHVDMDAFYASVETIKDPRLRGKPVIVGGQGTRGVVTSASYEAREFGVRSAMPIVTARRLCPHGEYISNDFASYMEYSKQIRAVFTSFTPLVEPLSLDEAFLDVSGSVRIFGPPVAIGRQIKAGIEELGLKCTVGVAPNKFLAKLASARAKPDGFLVVEAGRVESFLHPLPVTALWGVGDATADSLKRLGLRTVGDIASISRRTLERAVGDALGAHLHALANGRDDRTVVPDETAKSVGSEETFSYDLDDLGDILREILRLADRTAGRLRAKGLCARTITLKVRYSNFKTITRARTLPEEVDTATEIYSVVRDLYLKLDPERPRIRLLGVSVSGLDAGPPRRQLDLLGDAEGPRWDEAARAVDDIRSRFGDAAVAPATLFTSRE